MIFLLIAIGAFAADFGLKRYMEEHLEENGTPKKIFNGKAVLLRLSNRGSAGGFFGNHSKEVRNASAAVLGAAAIRFVILLFQKGGSFLKCAYALMLGGGAGNLVDRWMHGYVTDFLSLRTKFGKLNRLVFNLADVFIFIGTILAILGSLFSGKDRTERK